MITLSHISLVFGDRTIFDSISCSFELYQKIGVVGRNGAGKSTLLKIISGYQKADSGSISKNKECTVAYLPQEVVLESNKYVFDEACIHIQAYLDLEHEKNEIERALDHHANDADSLCERYSTIQEQLSHFDRHKSEQEVHTILDGLGFSAEQKKMPVSSLSVGWKMRLVLAQLLLQKADFYLFDEPTNHLDIVTKRWFFDFLRQSRTGYLLISHDRHFLEHACDKTLELERGHATLYNGNLSTYIQQKEEQQAIQLSAFNRQQREIERKQATIDRFRASASKARMAQSMLKQLDKIERIEIEPPLPTINVIFPPITPSASVVLELDNISYQFANKPPLFTSIAGQIQRGERIALVAPNGMGKTTLFNLITKHYATQSGSIILGNNVSVGVFEQDQTKALKASNSIFDEINSFATKHSEQTIRSFLGSFLFSSDDIYKKIGVLSGGEKNRVAMVKVLLSNANFLILDEPTNHLDMYAQEVLVQALEKYKGTILFVSHDHVFIQRLATRIIELTPSGLLSYPGSYELYLMQRAKNSNNTVTSQKNTASEPTPKNMAKGKEQGATKKRIYQLEQSITKQEKERDALGIKISSHRYGTPEYHQITQTIQQLDSSIAQLTQEWEELTSQVA